MISDFFVSIGLKDWEQWSYAAVILTLFVNAGFFAALIFQIRQGRTTLKESQRSSEAAENAVREARRARIDEQSPRVYVTLEKPLVWKLRDSNGFTVEADPEYVIPSMSESRLLFSVNGEIYNEGKGVARVRLNGNGAMFLTDNEADDPMPVGELPASTEERVLKPGEKIRFIWSDGQTLANWIDAYKNPSPPNPHGACFMEVIVTDYRADGIIDHIHLEMSGRPIAPVEGDDGRWRHEKADSIVAISYPSHRTYRLEGWNGLESAWAETYKEWELAHAANNADADVAKESLMKRITRLLIN